MHRRLGLALSLSLAVTACGDSVAPNTAINLSGTYRAVSFDGGPLDDSYLGDAQCFAGGAKVPTRLDRMVVTFHDNEPDPEERDDLSGVLAQRYECGRLNNEIRWPVPGTYTATVDSVHLVGVRFNGGAVAWDGGTDSFEVEVVFPGDVRAVVSFQREGR